MFKGVLFYGLAYDVGFHNTYKKALLATSKSRSDVWQRRSRVLDTCR